MTTRKIATVLTLLLICSFSRIWAVTKYSKPNQEFQFDPTDMKLQHKIVPLGDPVYQLIDYFETKEVVNYISMVKPYTRVTIMKILNDIYNSKNISDKEKKVVERYIRDYTTESNSFELGKSETENSFLMAGLGADINIRSGMGEGGTISYSGMIKPFFSGDLGKHITFNATLGVGGEKLAADCFYRSYTKNAQVVFPNDIYGYSWLPYQFQYESDWIHYKGGWSSAFSKKTMLAIYTRTEFNTSWLNGAFQLNMNNQRRSWGHCDNNLFLAATARAFPGIEMKIQPVKWFSYSFLAGALFFNPMEQSNYLQEVYGTDLGRAQKMLSCHIIELTPFHWLQLTAAGNAIWAKRLELAYFAPFNLPSLVQDNLGDQDNASLYFDVATRLGKIGKAWLGFYIDDFSLTSSSQIMRIPTNKYAWQAGWKTNLLSDIVPGTLATLSYTRLTPMVYTHYPESSYSSGNGRPIDMTYTHDGFNLGFYLPPNSAEYALKLENMIIPDLILNLDTKMIIHGTNDLSSQNKYQIYGDIYYDVYRSQTGDKSKFPLLNFRKDGIYDYTILSELMFDWKVRTIKGLNYFRIKGSVGYGQTWWESNNSGVNAPSRRNFLTGNLGISVDI